MNFIEADREAVQRVVLAVGKALCLCSLGDRESIDSLAVFVDMVELRWVQVREDHEFTL